MTEDGQLYFNPRAPGDWPVGVTHTAVDVLIGDSNGEAAVVRVAVDVVRNEAGYATDALTPSAVLSSGDPLDYLNGMARYSLRVEGNMQAGDRGLLYETGGRFKGLYLYAHVDGAGEHGLVFKAGRIGNGAFDESVSPNTFAMVAAAPSGEFVIEASIDESAQRAALYVNGSLEVLLEGNAYLGDGGVGGGPGQVGAAADGDAMAANFPDDISFPYTFEGVIDRMLVYYNQVTADIA